MQRTFDNFASWSTAANGAGEDALNHQLAMFVETLQAHAGGSQGYRLRRIILTNFWLYGQQEFEIPHGRLFLAGENASGKSTVLTAALPLALDGDLRPNRLDTFGGRERHIEYYVLGGSTSATPFSHERRTSYIALEFEWCDPDTPPIAQEIRQRWENGDRERTRFLTIGLSIAGNANASDRIRPLRFLITDGSRLGYDLHTVYESGNRHEKRANDHSRFKQLLAGHGIICDTQAEYERQVARYLFGFADEKDFQKLINLLLVLRRPNLSSELSFSRVHDYLKQSLPKISGETTHRVIGTIERIDTITSEIERIQEAYDATERLHRTRQHLALVRAQLAAGDYISSQLLEDNITSRVTKLRKDLSSADNERKRAETRSQALQAEQYQVNGQIKALEASEGLQVARQLTSARERTREAEAQLHLQEQSLEALRHSIHEYAASLARQRLRFEKMKAEGITHLRELRSIAADESYWEVAALQLEEALHQLNSSSVEAAAPPDMPLSMISLITEQAEERISWLRYLEELHQQREKAEARVQNARNFETTRFQELDDARRRFQSVRDRAYEAQQNLNQALEQFTAAMGSQAESIGGWIDSGDEPNASELDDEELQPHSVLTDDESLTGRVVEQFAAALNNYRQTIDALERELSSTAEQAQSKLDELQLLKGSKLHEIAELNTLYEQKLAEPEFVPRQSAHRTLARAKLAAQGIAALPLYALLDFAPNIDRDSDEAGRIEYQLEDAGLLYALVVPSSQIAAADAILAAEDLSDCRLHVDVSFAGTLSADAHPLIDWLRPDPSASEYIDDNNIDWQELASVALTAISSPTNTTNLSLNADGTWTHGLLIGRAGAGTARCIGRATRLRVRQRELEKLDEQRAQLDDELQELTAQLTHYEQQIAQLQDKQSKLRKVLSNSGIEELHPELAQARLGLDDARGKYAKARLQSQEAKEGRNTLIFQLERESRGIVPLASEPKLVQNALMGVVRLKNQVRSLQSQMTHLTNTWEECQQTSGALKTSEANESNAAHLAERVRYQALQARAEQEELQRVAEFADAEELSERLRTLRERGEALAPELDAAKASYVRADERVNNSTSNLAEAEQHLWQAQAERGEKQAHFIGLLTTYPVEQLGAVYQLATDGETVSAAHQLLAMNSYAAQDAPRESDLPPLKERLEAEYRDAYNALVRTFNREQPVLLEYGPDLDDAGNVLFLNEHRSRPVELLELLSERIEMQKTLLGQEERQLFEDFLLQEIAEAIRTHILDAETWVQQINGVLSNLPMIGEHYALQWKALDEYDPTKLGSHLAQHYKLLRKPAQVLTAEEAETLMNAFRQEIATVRDQQQRNPETNFMEALELVFDYREWFHFDVLVTPIGGQRQRLTDRVAGTRSGAEQLFALYVPLFAALGAIYRGAPPGAPRLLALDEAFDKVSVANTQRIMEFLVSQDFQWIMTGPQVSGTGAKIPACARYLMIHEKGSSLATASASFWSDKEMKP